MGRPNVGKSTLLNRLTGEKLAIVSPKPQTTRHRILGVVTRPGAQVAFLDTPGIHEAKGALNRRMVEVALDAIRNVDLVLMLIEPPAKPEIVPGNRLVLQRVAASKKPVVLAINKVDAIAKPKLLPVIDLYRTQAPFLEIVPISAKTGEGVDRLFDLVASHLPEGEPHFPTDTLTDQAERVLVAEYIREQVIHLTRQELPYATAAAVDVFDESEREPKPGPRRGPLAGLIRIAATIYVERESQKPILVGKGGRMLKEIGTNARQQIERLLGTHVYLSIRVKVERDWSERVEALRKMGYA